MQYLSEKLDISLEAKKISSAFEDAKNLLVDRSKLGVVLDEIPPSNLLLDPIIRRLRSAIDRWNSVEEKLRNSVSKADPNHQVCDMFFCVTCCLSYLDRHFILRYISLIPSSIHLTEIGDYF